MIVTIDGPAGTGKSSVAREVARRLGCEFLDTGAMYRAVALEAVRRGTDLEDARALAFVARHCRMAFDWTGDPPELMLNDEAVGRLLRGAEVTRAASKVAVVGAIREQLVEHQARIGREHGRIVTEGRDQGTVVFPEADFKFWLDATAGERARRRAHQLRSRGEIVDAGEILREIIERDARDADRAIAPMKPASDAVRIDTTEMSEARVIEAIVAAASGGGGR